MTTQHERKMSASALYSLHASLSFALLKVYLITSQYLRWDYTPRSDTAGCKPERQSVCTNRTPAISFVDHHL